MEINHRKITKFSKHLETKHTLINNPWIMKNLNGNFLMKQ